MSAKWILESYNILYLTACFEKTLLDDYHVNGSKHVAMTKCSSHNS